MRRAIVLAVAALSLLAMALPANASISLATVQGWEYEHAPPSPVGRIAGNITCTAGQDFLLRVNLRQNGEVIAIGRAGGTCTGSLQSWTATNVRTYGNFFCTDPFTFGGQARTEDGDRHRLVDNVPNCPGG